MKNNIFSPKIYEIIVAGLSNQTLNNVKQKLNTDKVVNFSR